MRAPLRSCGLRLLALAASLIGVVWLVVPPGSVPLYDGVGFPDEPYRYVVPPPGYQATPPPTSAHCLTTVVNGLSGWVGADSNESGPQVALQVDIGGFSVPTGTTRLTVQVDPVAPPAAGAPDAIAGWSNIYAITASTDVRGTITEQKTGEIFMRAPTGPPPLAVMEYNDGSGWHALKTTRTGNDIYSAPMTGLGRYVLVRSTKPAGHNLTWLVIVPAAALALLCGLVVALRIRRTKSTDPDSHGSLSDDVARFAAMATSALPSVPMPDEQRHQLQARIEELRGSSEETETETLRGPVEEVVDALRQVPSPSLLVSSALVLGQQVLRRLPK